MNMVSCTSVEDLISVIKSSIATDGNVLPSIPANWTLDNPTRLQQRVRELSSRSEWSISQDNGVVSAIGTDPLWEYLGLLWAVCTHRRFITVDKLAPGMGRPVFVGPPNSRMDVMSLPSEYWGHTPALVTAHNIGDLIRLMHRTLTHREENHIRVSLLTDIDELRKPVEHLSDDTAGVNLLLAVGHAGDNRMVIEPLTLCGQNPGTVPTSPWVPTCQQYGECISDIARRRAGRGIEGQTLFLRQMNIPWLVLLGCNTLSLTQNAFGPAFDMGVAALSGNAVAVLGTFYKADVEPRHLSLLVNLIESGCTLGEVADLVNQGDRMSQKGLLDIRIFGDPGIRLVPHHPIPTTIVDSEGSSATTGNVPVMFAEASHAGQTIASTTDAFVHQLSGGRVLLHGLTPNSTVRLESLPSRNIALEIVRITNLRLALEHAVSIRMVKQKQVNQALATFDSSAGALTKAWRTNRNEIEPVIQTVSDVVTRTGEQVIQGIIEASQSRYLDFSNAYDTRYVRMGWSYRTCQCGFSHALTEHVVIPGTPIQRVKFNCPNCGLMTDFPILEDVEFRVRADKVFCLEHSTIEVSITNKGTHALAYQGAAIVELGRRFDLDTNPGYWNMTIACGESRPIVCKIENGIDPVLHRHHLLVLAMIDLHWFFASQVVNINRCRVPDTCPAHFSL